MLRAWCFLTELGWREFAHHLLWHFPIRLISPCAPNSPGFRGATMPLC